MSALQYLQANPTSFVVVAGVLGLFIGSFLNVVILRLPVVMERNWRDQCAELLEVPAQLAPTQKPFNLIVPRSRCPQCGHRISAFENVPVFSYLWLKGRCSACGGRISPRYPVVEILSGVLAAIVAWHFGFGLQAAGALLLTWALIALTFIDLDHHLLPDPITLPWLWLGLGFNLFAVYVSTHASLLGAMAGYGVLWSVYQLFRLATGKEGMGYGDFKLMAMLGAWLGWQALPITIVVSSLAGAVIGVILILVRGHDRNVPIPFGPYIAVAGWIALLWGQDLSQWYLNWSGFR